MTLLLVLFACIGAPEDPCADYCQAICDCDSTAACDDCHAVYDDADASLQNECESALAAYECAADSGG